MTKHPIVDLHMHTAVSDGTDTPAELLARVKEAGVTVFSVADHDAIAGCEAIRALLKPGDPAFLFGVEFSCKDALGKYHILGYDYDPNAEAIRSVVDVGHARRLKKLGLRLQMLKEEFGLSFPKEEVSALYSLSNPGKPHLANLMVLHGYAQTRKQAFCDFLNRLRVPDDYTLPQDAIRGILGASGVPVLAHPCFGDGDQLILGDELKERVRRLTAYGLAGLEAYYSGFTETLRSQVLALAEEFDLYVTAGSDYHGSNKLILPADTGLRPGDPLPERLERFLNDRLTDK